MHKFYSIILIFIFLNTSCIAQVEWNKDWQLLIPNEGLHGWHYYQDKRATKQAGPMRMGYWYLTHHLKKVIRTIA